MSDLPAWLQPLREAARGPGRKQAVREGTNVRGGRQAAVLILFADRASGREIVFVERSATLRAHPGQIAFPGGSKDPGDHDLIATALRETTEEVGVDAADVEVFATLPTTLVEVSGFDVTAVLGWWRQPAVLHPVDPSEVAAVYQVPISALVDPGRRMRVRHPSGYTGPAFQVADITIWGLTAHFTDVVLRLAGWETPWDETRVIAVPERHLRDHRKVTTDD